MNELLRRLEAEFETQFAFELRAAGLTRVYLIDADAHGIQLNASCGGCIAADSCWLHRGEIGDAWGGPGPCAVLSSAGVIDPADLAAVAVHELAHAVDFGVGSIPRTPPRRLDLHRQIYLSDLAAVDMLATPPAPEMHGSRFARVALHLAWRMVRAGWTIPVYHLLSYGMDGWDCFHTLNDADEFERLADLPLSTISAIPAPPEFAALFPRESVLQGIQS